MKRGVWHQMGYNSQKLIIEQLQNSTGVGVIISPRYLQFGAACEYAKHYADKGAAELHDPGIRPPDAAVRCRGPVWRCADQAQNNQASCELEGSYCVPGPDLTDHLPLPFVDLLTRPTFPWPQCPIVDQHAAAAGTR